MSHLSVNNTKPSGPRCLPLTLYSLTSGRWPPGWALVVWRPLLFALCPLRCLRMLSKAPVPQCCPFFTLYPPCVASLILGCGVCDFHMSASSPGLSAPGDPSGSHHLRLCVAPISPSAPLPSFPRKQHSVHPSSFSSQNLTVPLGSLPPSP